MDNRNFLEKHNSLKTSALAKLPVLGVGINYQKSFRDIVARRPELLNFLEFNPDALCTWRQQSDTWHLLPNPQLFHEFKQTLEQLPTIAHGLSLSIGSASGMNAGYLQLLDAVTPEISIPWHSEHLGFLDLLTPAGEYLHAGTQLPMPFTEEAIVLLVPRIRQIIARYKIPFLLENTTYYLPGIDSHGMNEVEFLNRLCAQTGEQCGLLLDLYNFYCNSVNFGFDPFLALDKLDMARVVEIHIAGGNTHKGFQLDVHSSHVPAPVWELLQWILPRAPNVKALVFELLEQAFDAVTEPGICRNLELANEHWQKSRRQSEPYRERRLNESV